MWHQFTPCLQALRLLQMCLQHGLSSGQPSLLVSQTPIRWILYVQRLLCDMFDTTNMAVKVISVLNDSRSSIFENATNVFFQVILYVILLWWSSCFYCLSQQLLSCQPPLICKVLNSWVWDSTHQVEPLAFTSGINITSCDTVRV